MLKKYNEETLKKGKSKVNLIHRLVNDKSFREQITRLLILLSCVCISVLSEYCALHALAQSPYPTFLTSIYFLISFVSSPFVTGFSDNDKRKLMLVFSLLICTFVFSYIFFIGWSISLLPAIILVLIFGCFGNLIEISWAAMGDERLGSENARSLFAISNSFMAIAALIFSTRSLFRIHIVAKLLRNQQVNPQNSPLPNFLFALASLIILVFLFIKYKSQHDQDKIGGHTSTAQHLKEFWNKAFLLGISIFFLWEFSFYLMHQIGIDLSIRPFNSVTKWMAIGYIIGTLILSLLRKKSEKGVITFGHAISIFSLISGIFLAIFSKIPLYNVVDFSLAFFAIGTAFLSPTLFSLVSAKVPIHRQGALFGLYGSADTFATAIALLIGKVASHLIQHLHRKFGLNFISPLIILSISLFTMISAFILYGFFRKHHKH